MYIVLAQPSGACRSERLNSNVGPFGEYKMLSSTLLSFASASRVLVQCPWPAQKYNFTGVHHQPRTLGCAACTTAGLFYAEAPRVCHRFHLNYQPNLALKRTATGKPASAA